MRALLPFLSRRFAAACACAVAASASLAAPPVASCRAQSGARVPVVIELYTSQGCSSCPPAEHWLSALKARDDVVALAFHVDYWDSLGWRDRFAQPQFTQRQSDSRRDSGARFAYTPQVLVDGRDTPDWSARSGAALARGTPSTLALMLERDGDDLRLTVTPGSAAAPTLKGYVAVVDDGLRTAVGAGENRGATLGEDGVVRELLPWSAPADRPSTLGFRPPAPSEAGATRRWIAVATDSGGRTLQAVTLACPR